MWEPIRPLAARPVFLLLIQLASPIAAARVGAGLRFREAAYGNEQLMRAARVPVLVVEPNLRRLAGPPS